MKFSENSITEMLSINKKISTKRLSEMLTMSGLEVNSVINKKNKYIKIIIGKINKIKIEKNNFSLNINIGKLNLINIIYNKNKFKINDYVLVVKKKLNNNFKYEIILNKKLPLIKIKKFNLGDDVTKYFNIENDNIFNISIPFNRTDCLSILGVSRELSNKYFLKLNILEENEIKSTLNNKFNINIKNNNLSYYYGKIIKNISTYKKTPILINYFLKKHSVIVNNNIYDIINYISLKTGYYIHIIDISKSNNNIVIDFLKKKYNKYIENNKYIPIINDTNNNPILIPNIVNKSNFDKSTKNILLGCAIFNSNNIPLKLCNEFIKNNFYKYTQGINPYLLKYVIEYSTKILIDIVGGDIKELIIKKNEKKNKKIINISFFKIRKKIGCSIRNKTIIKILKNIKCIFHKINKKNIILSPPNYRLDIYLEEDLIEEILKIYGINKISNKKISSIIDLKPNNLFLEKENLLYRIKTFLIDRGYQEIISYSFVEKNYQSLFCPNNNLIYIENPMSIKNTVMRSSLITGLIKTIFYNKRRKEENIKIFESGNCFEYNNKKINIKHLLSGAILINKYNLNDTFFKNNTLYNIRSDIENIMLFSLNKNEFYFKKEENYFLYNNYSLSIFFKKNKIGFFGIINNDFLNKISYNELIIFFEINLNFLKLKKINSTFRISKFSIIKRDISITIKKNINIEYFIKNKFLTKEKNITKVEFIDIYIDKNFISNYKNITVRLFIQNYKKNLSELDINNIIKLYIENIKKKIDLKLNE